VGPFLVTGAVTGSIYAVLALGLVLMYQTTGVVNVAIGAVGAMGAFGFHTLSSTLSVWWAFATTLVLAALVGALVGVVTIPVQGADTVTKSIAALGLVAAVPALIFVVWGPANRLAPVLSARKAFRLGGVTVDWQDVFTLAASLVVAALMLAGFRFGKLGSAMRTMAVDVRTAQLIGLPVRLLWVVSWVTSTVVAALGAVLALPSTSLSVAPLTFTVLVPVAAAFAAQFRHPSVALLAGFAGGVAEGVMARTATTQTYRGVVPMAIAVFAVAVVRGGYAQWERV
jgi:branched-chain amino acid transport system permease protein